MNTGLHTIRNQFGTAPVFLTAISTILGAVMFLRFGYAVGNVGFVGTLVIIVIGHLITIPTAMALAEIATNQKVEGGGEYYVISRSFGLNIGAATGIALFLSQAVSVAFYVIAFAEAFGPVFDYLNQQFGWALSDRRIISVPTMVVLAIVMFTKGADVGVKALYVVVSILFIALLFFFVGSTPYGESIQRMDWTLTVANPDDFFIVFAIVFPAFTGMTAGVGLSGDLKDPKKSIPLGTLAATITGMVCYVFIAYKLAASASPDDLNNDQLIMQTIAIWGPIIPIGLAAATLSSALGSILVAPRTLQAIAGDKIFPIQRINAWLSMGRGRSKDPMNATIITSVVAMLFIAVGDVNFVASIISMFFMVTYGSICLISFLEHFAADPSYRPSFKSKWYLSLLGAVMCGWLMFKMDAGYAVLAILIMTGIYFAVSYTRGEGRGMASIFQGVIFQMSRQLQVFIQKAEKDTSEEHWRPSLVCMSKHSFQHYGAMDILRWIAQRYGFGTYVHFIEGYPAKATRQQATEALDRLITLSGVSGSNVYLDTLVAPSAETALTQILQLPGISGKENNTLLFEFAESDRGNLDVIIQNFNMIKAMEFDVCVLKSTLRNFGYHNQIDIWITTNDYQNANLMILLAYIILGHSDWKGGLIKIYSIFPEDQLDKQREDLLSLILSGRLPISQKNVELIAQNANTDLRSTICEKSRDADLTLIGFREEAISHDGSATFDGYEDMGNILFVNTTRAKAIE